MPDDSFHRLLLPPLRTPSTACGRSPSLEEGGLGMRKSKVSRISAGARCAPLQRGGNRSGEMHLQRWVLSLQQLVAPPYPVGARIARPFVPDVITTTLREGARRVIGATAKPLYPIDGKAAGLDRRNPKPSLFEGGEPPRGRWRGTAPWAVEGDRPVGGGGGPPRGRWKESAAVEGVHRVLPKIRRLCFICFICSKHMMFSSKTIRCPSGECRDNRHRNRFLPFRPCPSAAESPLPQGSSPFLKPCCRTAPRPRRFSERR